MLSDISPTVAARLYDGNVAAAFSEGSTHSLLVASFNRLEKQAMQSLDRPWRYGHVSDLPLSMSRIVPRLPRI